MSDDAPIADSQLSISGLQKPKETIKFHNIKSTQFRVVHAEGAWCSVNPHDNIHLIFYNERAPVPQESVFEVEESGDLGQELYDQRKIRDGYVRELEVDVVINKLRAADLYYWLGKTLGYIKDEDQQ